MLNEQIDVLSLSPVERKLYESRMKLKSDIATISESQFKAGMEQGFSNGVRQTALAFKHMGLPLSQIAKATGLSEEEIEKLY